MTRAKAPFKRGDRVSYTYPAWGAYRAVGTITTVRRGDINTTEFIARVVWDDSTLGVDWIDTKHLSIATI